MNTAIPILFFVLLSFNQSNGQSVQEILEGSFFPNSYTASKTERPIVVDGILEPAWELAQKSELFADIEGKNKTTPEHETYMQMLWDNNYLYVAASIEEPHVWAKLTERDAVVYYDDDFEIFIDPDGDGHFYTEIEVNAWNTVWDLMLTKPYRVDDENKVIWQWDIAGLQTATNVQGSINDPSNTDKGWTVEVAIPMKNLKEFAHKKSNNLTEDIWRINFSRVDWLMDITKSKYEKRTDSIGKTLPERNWVWSPQGKIAMHMPEMWGYLIFADGDKKAVLDMSEEMTKYALWHYYEQMLKWKAQKGTYCKNGSKFTLPAQAKKYVCDKPNIETTSETFLIKLKDCTGKYHYKINEQGKIKRVDE